MYIWSHPLQVWPKGAVSLGPSPLLTSNDSCTLNCIKEKKDSLMTEFCIHDQMYDFYVNKEMYSIKHFSFLI